MRFERRTSSLTDPAVSADGVLVALCPRDGQGQRIRDTVRRRSVPGGWERAHGACGQGAGLLPLGRDPTRAAKTQLHLWTLTGQPNQRWQMAPVPRSEA